MEDSAHREKIIADLNILIYKSQFEEALSKIESLKVDDDSILKIELNLIISKIYREKDDYEKSLTWADKVIDQLKTLEKSETTKQDLDRLYCGGYTSKAYALWFFNELSEVEKYLKKASERIVDGNQLPNNFKNQVAEFYRLKANYYASLGENEKLLKYNELSFDLCKETGNKGGMALVLHNNGVMYRDIGELSTAFEKFHQSFELYEEIGSRYGMVLSQLMMASIYRRRGEIEEQFNLIQNALPVVESIGSKLLTAWTYLNLGSYYQEKGDHKHALAKYEQVLLLLEETGRPDNIVMTLGIITELNLILGKRAEIPPLLERINAMKDKYNDLEITLASQYVRGLYLKSSKRARDKIDAERIFTRIVTDKIINHDTTMKSMMHLAEILLDELNLYGEDEVFEEIKELVDQFIEIAESQKSVKPRIRALIIKTKLAIINKDFASANQILDEALQLAKPRNFGDLVLDIENQKRSLRESIMEMQKLIDNNASYAEMTQKLQIMEYLKKAQDIANSQ